MLGCPVILPQKFIILTILSDIKKKKKKQYVPTYWENKLLETS